MGESCLPLWSQHPSEPRSSKYWKQELAMRHWFLLLKQAFPPFWRLVEDVVLKRQVTDKHKRQSRVLWPPGGKFYYIKLCLNLNIIMERRFPKDFLWVLPYLTRLKTMMDKATVQKGEVIVTVREKTHQTNHLRGVSQNKGKENYDR